MTKIDIVSGFLGAGKTTLIKKLLKEALANTKVVLIENEFGEIGIDGGFLKEAGIEIKEMNSGCICCSLVGDFGTSLKEVLKTYEPERILIEPSGVGKLSDVMKAVQEVVAENEVELNSAVAVVDATKCRMYIKNFGEFFVNQIEHAGTIILSRTGKLSEEKLAANVALIREYNEKAVIVTTPWEELEGADILATIEGAKNLEAELMEEVRRGYESHNHHEHDENCGCHEHHGHSHNHEEHHHEHDKNCGCHEHHEHSHNQEGSCGCHGDHHDHHHHDHGENCGCGCHDHEHAHSHEGHHHADDVFVSWGMETAAAYDKAKIEGVLESLEEEEQYGIVLRAKGMVPAGDGTWIYFDYVPGEFDIRTGRPDVTGKICVIGSGLNEDNLKRLFEKA
ncbi:CobW family GTP-binding protein [Kineothrix sp. MB12-C1]|uniref:CobW family GTP-binding protein n=1 Tax=Kineothrix sp. MB12-C1 TaxID=3070215 RepID=UPI0027D2D5CB|nr:CobW family GTP-binding protein [Kineothrix sp. MB12-C1]WMC92114.1 CobW family GTP-binding protein [Kineothrix sp. MB12-C1]